MGRLETSNDIAIAVDEELGEVPLDVGSLAPTWVHLVEHLFETWSQLVVGIKALEALLLLQIGEQRRCVLTIDLNLGELWELNVIVGCAELVNLGLCAGSLLTKLIAREVENGETLGRIISRQC